MRFGLKTCFFALTFFALAAVCARPYLASVSIQEIKTDAQWNEALEAETLMLFVSASWDMTGVFYQKKYLQDFAGWNFWNRASELYVVDPDDKNTNRLDQLLASSSRLRHRDVYGNVLVFKNGNLLHQYEVGFTDSEVDNLKELVSGL